MVGGYRRNERKGRIVEEIGQRMPEKSGRLLGETRERLWEI